jgi:uncharacterized protein
MSQSPQSTTPARAAAGPPNALIHETSPYLLQHAYNPVAWLPWGEAAFAKARAEDKPILLSVGYSACHWCHVMEHESFEDPAIAAMMNANFVPVKVDREERPDVDAVYMAAVQAVSGAGGWPMTVFLMPSGEPFYAGTYYPNQERYGRISFPRLLATLHDAWQNRRQELEESGRDLTAHLASSEKLKIASGPVEPNLAERAVMSLGQQFDRSFGGFGAAPKFPNPGALEFLLQYHARNPQDHHDALVMCEQTLAGMARGGLYDQLAGGFARYSTDERWLAPHFEKMLYDNAQLLRVYLHAFQVTGKLSYARIVGETADYLLREMQAPLGGFYSAQDADSEGEEGKFYVFSQAELQQVLGHDAAWAADFYGVSSGGNWEGKNILTRQADPAPNEQQRLADLRQRLLEYRNRRVHPALDDKIVLSWNGLALAALAEAGRVLDEPRYLAAANKNAEFIRTHMSFCDENGRLRLYHTFKSDTNSQTSGTAKIFGMLDDYTLTALGLLELYRANHDQNWLQMALDLTASALDLFTDPEHPGFFDTPNDGERLIVRPKGIFDSAMPCGNGSMALLLQQLGHLTDNSDWQSRALALIPSLANAIVRQPTGFGSFLQVIEGHLRPLREVVVLGEAGAARTALETVLNRRYLPHVAVVVATADLPPHLPLLVGKTLAGGQLATAFVCENLACQLPTSDGEVLQQQLDAQ